MTGVLPVDKPAGPSSHDVVAAARRALGERRIGHTGTLDPFATGLLLLCVGPATRLAEFLTGLDKRYEAAARLGIATDTLDDTGAVVSETDRWQALDPARIRAAFEEQAGPLSQRPPVYSAKKVGGRRAYEMAREGQAVRPDPVDVVVHELDVTHIDPPFVRFRMHCSSGTYVRAIARDAGEALDVGAHLTALRRTAIGSFVVDDALAPDRLEDAAAVDDALISPLDALSHLPVVSIDADEVRKVGHGQALSPGGRVQSGLVVLASDGALVAIAEADARAIRPRKVFA
jgi:tRNA pseudouridine55 synthase